MEFDKETSEAMTRLAENAADKIEKDAVEAYKAIERGTVDAYKAIEHGTVGTYKKIENAFVDNFLKKEGETVEDAKERLAAEQKAREAKMYHPIPKKSFSKADTGKEEE